MEGLIRIIAKNPATILIAGGLFFLATGAWFSWLLIIAGMALNVGWLLR